MDEQDFEDLASLVEELAKVDLEEYTGQRPDLLVPMVEKELHARVFLLFVRVLHELYLELDLLVAGDRLLTALGRFKAYWKGIREDAMLKGDRLAIHKANLSIWLCRKAIALRQGRSSAGGAANPMDCLPT